MVPDVPLLNDHKQEFLLRRLPQTFLGGPRFKLGRSAPCYIYVNQIILFLIPWVLGGVGTLLYQLGILHDYCSASFSGGLMIAAATIIQAIAFCAKRRSKARVQIHNILADEDEWEFSGCLGSETMKFIIPGKKYVFNIIRHSVLAGVLCALGTWYLLPNRITSLYDGNIGASVAVFVFGWVTVCIGEYSLIVNTPSETAAFQALDTCEITPLMRPFYISVFVAVDLAQRLIGDIPELKLANQVLHIVFLVLPFLWTLGVLPPLDALFLWGVEQVLEIGLGGSPMSSNLRLLGMVLISVGTAVASHYIPSSVGVVLFMTGFGFALSLNLSEIGFALKDAVISCLPCKKFRDGRSCRMQLRWRTLIFHLTVFTLALLEAGLLHSMLGSLVFSITCLQAIISYVLLVLLMVTWILREIQTVYVFGIFRNPFYPKDVTTVNVFMEKQKGLLKISYFKRILTNLVSPLAMIAFLSLDNSLHRLPSVYISIGFSRSFRMVWQNTECALLDMVVVSAVQLLVFDTDLWWNRSIDMGTKLLLVGFIRNRLFQFVSKLQFALTILLTSWTEKKQRRKSSATLIMLNIIFFPVVLALIALSALLSSPLLPLFTLPIFLIGFPRPIRSWPGPVGVTACVCHDTIYYQQMAPHLVGALQSALSSGSLGLCLPGSHYLCRFQDRLVWILVLEKGFSYCCVSIKACGQGEACLLGLQKAFAKVPHQWLLRKLSSQGIKGDVLLWIENWLKNRKQRGLELQETSCHTAEARRVDEIFERTFVYQEHTQSPSFNHHFGNVLTPCTVLPVKLYSDARNILSGIIDSPSNRRQLKDDFIKILIWVLVPYCYKKLKAQKQQKEASKRASPSNPPEVLIRTIVRMKEEDRVSMDSVDDWTDDSNLFDPESGRGAPEAEGIVPRPFSSLSGSVDIHTVEDELAEPADVNKLDKEVVPDLPAKDTGKRERVRLPRTSFSSPYCELVAIPDQWRKVPHPDDKFDEMRQRFPESWFHFVLRHLYFTKMKDDHFSLLGDLFKDATLQEVYLEVVLSCCIGMFGSDNNVLSAGQILRTYSGGIPWSNCMDWLMRKQELFQLALKAFRSYSLACPFHQSFGYASIFLCYKLLSLPNHGHLEDLGSCTAHAIICLLLETPSNVSRVCREMSGDVCSIVKEAGDYARYAVKLMIDQACLGPVHTFKDLLNCLEDYENNWFMGLPEEKEWQQAVQQEKPYLFSLGHDADLDIYTSRVLTLQDFPVPVGKLSSEAVRGQWANLSWELLYATNDDEERFSIQAHPVLLRNLTTQAADPPLGYPIYFSEPLHVPLL